MRFLTRLFPSVAAAFALAACGGQAEGAPRPAMWKVSDPDTTIYLFGTIHMLPKDFNWRTKKFDAAVASADTLVLEIADQQDQRKVAATFQQMATTPGLPPLPERIAAEQRPALSELMRKAKLVDGQLDSFETWAAALTLGVSLYNGIGATAEDGVERQLTVQFSKDGKPIEGLETTPQQLGYFDKMPETSQRVLLASIVQEAEESSDQFREMTSAWSRGDLKKIAMTFDDELRLSPELADVLLRQRNANWAGWLEKRLDQPGTIMVAVGAGHLAGKDSVVEMLEAKGLKVERVQ